MSEDNSKLQIRNARLAFPNLFTPQEPMTKDGKPRYTATLLLDPKDPQIAKIRKAMESAAQAKWPKTWAENLKACVRKDDICLRDGNDKSKYDGFADHLYLSTAAPVDARPLVIDQAKRPLTEADGVIYPGCYVNAIVEIYAQDNHGRKGINASLSGVQFVREGPSFAASRPASVDEFDDISDGADADGFEDETEGAEEPSIW